MKQKRLQSKTGCDRMSEPIEVGDLVVYKSDVGWVVSQHESNFSFWYVEWASGYTFAQHESGIKENKAAAKKLLNKQRSCGKIEG